jgi:hypothetical protein
MPNDPLVPVHISTNIDSRVTLPKPFADRLPWITGKEVDAWWFLLEAGRHRLLSDEQVQSDPQLEPVRLLVLQQTSGATAQPSYTMRLRDAAIVARLVPITAKLHQGSWRVPFPKEFEALAPTDVNPSVLSILFSPEAYVEIWHTDVLRKAVSLPLGL